MIGIIAEYNPFHNGHLYHLNKVREMFPDKVITLVLAGNFLNRGDVSIINKWDKTKLALQYGVDLVIELPFVFASQAADIYAYGAISLLNHLKAEYVVFGSELNNINVLKEIANEFQEDKNIKAFLKIGFNYPTAIAKTYNTNLNSPNDLLGLSYIKAINKLNSTIIPLTIKRTNDYHNSTTNGKISSATSIRNCLKNSQDISDFIPKKTLKYIKNINLSDFFIYLKYQVITNDLTEYNIDSKLANSLKKKVNECDNLDELIDCVKTKNYTYNYIKRSLVQILCGIKKDDLTKEIEYIRILGFNEIGQKYLNKIKKDITIPIFSTFNPKLSLELKVSSIYSLVYGNVIKDELNKPIFIKKDEEYYD